MARVGQAMKAVMQRDDLPLHARCDHSGLAFGLDSFILPDDSVADLEAERFFSPWVHAQLSQVFLAVAIEPLAA